MIVNTTGSYKAFAMLSISHIILSICAEGAIAQEATIGYYGCGTGCSISVDQLSKPIRMGNGWSRVLVKETTRIRDAGLPASTTHKTFWQFAKCDGDVVGWGFRSDGLDARIDRIYDENGGRLEDNASGQLYTRWEVLCNAIH